METEIECISSLARLNREGALRDDEFQAVWGYLDEYREQWHEVSPHLMVKTTARRLLRIHPLRAGDALQLAAAIHATDNDPRGISFVTFDQRLANAAAKEGFSAGLEM